MPVQESVFYPLRHTFNLLSRSRLSVGSVQREKLSITATTSTNIDFPQFQLLQVRIWYVEFIPIYLLNESGIFSNLAFYPCNLHHPNSSQCNSTLGPLTDIQSAVVLLTVFIIAGGPQATITMCSFLFALSTASVIKATIFGRSCLILREVDGNVENWLFLSRSTSSWLCSTCADREEAEGGPVSSFSLEMGGVKDKLSDEVVWVAWRKRDTRGSRWSSTISLPNQEKLSIC